MEVMPGKSPSLLMCAPDHYAIRYSINPWMKISCPARRDSSRRQWDRLVEILHGLKVEIDLVPPVPGLPDMVFTANAGLPVGDRVFLSRFRHPERRPESVRFRKWFEKKGFEILELPEGVFFEGAGDALFFGTILFAGYRFRSDVRAHSRIAEVLGIQVLSLELVDRRFYHLDTCFSPLDDRSVLYYPPAFDRYALQVIRENIPDPIPVPDREAFRFVCNAVVVGRDVVFQAGCPETVRVLEERGFRVHETDLSEFHKAGGSAKCLTLRIG